MKYIILFLICFIVLFSSIAMLFIYIIYGKFFKRYNKPKLSRFLSRNEISGYPFEKVSFMSGNNKLTGYLYHVSECNGIVVLSHGLSGGAETYLSQIMYFVDHGWTVFAYDCTGSYGSEGKNTIGLVQSELDLEAALHFIAQNPTLCKLPIMLYGHSWGGYAVTAVLNKYQGINASVSISGYNSPNQILLSVMVKIASKIHMGFLGQLMKPFVLLFHRLLFGKNSIMTAVDGINKCNIPIMIVHGKEDSVVNIEQLSILAKKKCIVNQEVIYKIISRDHFDVFRTDEACKYRKKLDLELSDLKEKYKGNIPYEKLKEYYEKIDKRKYCELDMDLMNEINNFYLKSLL